MAALRRQRLPVVISSLFVLGLVFVVRLFLPVLTDLLAFKHPGGGWPGVLTFPLTDVSPFGFVFACLWFYLAGGSLEHAWGSRRFGLFMLFAVPASSLPLLLGSLLLRSPVFLYGIALPMACLTVAWCLGNPNGVALFGFILPVPVKILLYIEFFLVYCYAAIAYTPLLGFFALIGPGTAVLYVLRLGPDRKWRQAVRRSRSKHGTKNNLRSLKPKEK